MGAGTKLKELLRKNNISVKELAKKGDISLNTLYSITKRDPKHISKELCEKIARALNMDLHEVSKQLNSDYFVFFFADDNNECHVEHVSTKWGDDRSNREHLEDKPELLDLYNEIRSREDMYILFDKVRDLDPKDVESILAVVQTIRKAKGFEE